MQLLKRKDLYSSVPQRELLSTSEAWFEGAFWAYYPALPQVFVSEDNDSIELWKKCKFKSYYFSRIDFVIDYLNLSSMAIENLWLKFKLRRDTWSESKMYLCDTFHRHKSQSAFWGQYTTYNEENIEDRAATQATWLQTCLHITYWNITTTHSKNTHIQS